MSEAWWGFKGLMLDDLNSNSKATSYAEHFQNSMFVQSVLHICHQRRYYPAHAPDPIIEEGSFVVFRKLGLTRFEASVFNGYAQMVYLQVSAPDSDR